MKLSSKHDKKVKEYEEKNFPKSPNKKNLELLQRLCQQRDEAQKTFNGISEEIKTLKLPAIIVNFAMDHPNLTITGTTDKLCSVFCAADNLKKMPYNASDVHIEDDKINFKVLLD